MSRRTFLALIALQVVAWTASPLLGNSSLPLDVGENLIWGQEWQLGYYKHPPLQAWLTELAFLAGGGHVWSVYLLGQILVAATLAGLWQLAREGGDARAGFWAAAVLLLCFFYGPPTNQPNANTVQMPFWAWSAVFLWRGIHSRSLRPWLWLGVMLAGAFYTKYSVIFLVAALVVAGLSLRAGRAALATPGPWVATGVALVLAVPHLWWLVTHDFLPISYAEAQVKPLAGIDRLTAQGKWLAIQIGAFLLAGVWLAIVRPGFRRPAMRPDARRYIDLLAATSLGSMMLYSAATGGEFDGMWSIPAIGFVGLALGMRLGPAIPAQRRRLAVASFLALYLLWPVGNAVWSRAAPHFGAQPYSSSWPMAEIAEQIRVDYAEALGGVPRILAGDSFAVGQLNYFLPGRQSAFVNARYDENPWITPERLDREGALFVWRGEGQPNPWPEFGPFAATGTARAQVGKVTTMLNWAARAPKP